MEISKDHAYHLIEEEINRYRECAIKEIKWELLGMINMCFMLQLITEAQTANYKRIIIRVKPWEGKI